MNIYINDRACEAATGERLIDVARKNHSHIGYFCGGNGICQTCYVKVLEGMELLSPLSDREKALLSDDLIEEGIRVACMTTLDKPGKVSLLTTIEEVKRTFETRPFDLVAYQGKMGWASLVKFPETIAMQAQRFSEGKLDPVQLVIDIAGAIGDAVDLVFRSLRQVIAGAAPEKKAFARQYVATPPKEASGKNGACDSSCAKPVPEIHESLKLQKHAPVN
ncbi:ferredoxin [Prosthecochloris sp. GSB1]|uniref:2Fe-2S iron-sulfur cluster-binding protein n=1 Tax=Prosthecochloris sp. GSB1 TaxID=281093 RepID=UPI000B8D0D8F|nr:2Fe-2S iron-sulfur cluster-binding protein [Prosthecochloris sp. GSB1]ASQ90796.1 ferredoxin [Prosthecochloris sp. GSB1]